MRIAMLALLAVATIIPSLGCAGGGARNACASCKQCGHGGHGGHGGAGGHGGCIRNGHFARHFGPQAHVTGAEEGAGAPQSAQVAYPYYTTRGPRDFLLNNPPPLGY